MRHLSFLLMTIPALLMSCSSYHGATTFQNRDTSYLKAKSVAPLHVPPGITMHGVENYYPISDRNYPESSKIVDLTPPGLYSNNG